LNQHRIGLQGPAKTGVFFQLNTPWVLLYLASKMVIPDQEEGTSYTRPALRAQEELQPSNHRDTE